MSDSDDMDARVAALGVVAAPHEYPLDEINTKRGAKIPSQDSIDLFSIETSSVPKFRVQFNPTVNHSPRELQGKITRNCFTFQFTTGR
jgi:hypothetical protein